VKGERKILVVWVARWMGRKTHFAGQKMVDVQTTARHRQDLPVWMAVMWLLGVIAAGVAGKNQRATVMKKTDDWGLGIADDWGLGIATMPA
jgi:hypothetical protein